jgi:hypothetical protein
MPDTMQCPDAAEWLQFADGEGSTEQQARLEAHRNFCAACRHTLADVLELSAVSEAAHLLGDATPPLRKALRRRPRWLEAVAAAALAALVVAGGLDGRSVLATALQLFQVQHLTAVQVTPEELSQMAQAISQGTGQVSLRQFGTVSFRGPATNYNIRPDALPARAGLPDLWPAGLGQEGVFTEVRPAQQVTFSLHVAHINALIQSLGGTHLLPSSLSGQRFEATVPTEASTYLNLGGNDSDVLMEMARPSLVLPATVPVAAVRDAVLNLPFLPTNLQQALSAVGDWRHTLVLPLPGQSETITFLGRPAILERENNNRTMAVLWLQGNVVAAFVENRSQAILPSQFLGQVETLFQGNP